MINQNKPLLTISLLISNRPDTIPRCLDSIKLIMKQLPCELILIDTSKSEMIHNMLLSYTDQVYEFEWCKDFAKARNEGVRRANGEWFMYIDDDEWLEDVEDIVLFFKSKEYKKHECANIWVRNYLDTKFTRYTDNLVTRLFYLGKGAKFEGKIHEAIYPIYGEPAFLQSVIHHSGYIFDTDEKRRAHFERNSTLLLEVIEEDPKNLRWQAQLVQEYSNIKEWQAEYDFCQKCLKNIKQIETFMERNHFCTLYAGLIEALMGLERHEEMVTICEQAWKDERSTELLKSHICLRMAENYVKMKEWDKAIEQAELYLKRYEYFEKNKENMKEQLGSLLVHLTFEKQTVETVYNMLIYSQLHKENLDTADLEESSTEVAEIDAMSGVRFVRFMVNLIATKEYRDVFQRFLSNVCQDVNLCNWACAEAQQWEQKDASAFEKIAYAFAQVESDFWYIRYCGVVNADRNSDKKEIEAEVERLVEVLPNAFFMPDKVYEIIDKWDIKIAQIWNKVLQNQWLEKSSFFVQNVEDVYIDKAYDYILDAYDQTDWRAESFPIALMERQIKKGMNVQVLDYHNLLCDYAERKLVCYYYFCEEYGAEANVPIEVRAAAKFKDYVEAEETDIKLALTCLKEAAVACPDFANGIAEFFQFYSEMGRQREARKHEEMEQLRIEVMEQINTMLKAGDVGAALQIVGQLKQMFPGDLEVAELALAIRLKSIK